MQIPVLLDLSEAELLILKQLQEEPLISMHALGKLLGISSATARRKVQMLKEKGVLRKDRELLVPFLGRRWQTEVESVYSPEALGMRRLHAFLVSPLPQVQKMLDVHPYVHYYVMAYGTQQVLYVQFDAPRLGVAYLMDFLNELQSRGFVRYFTSLLQEEVVTTEFRLGSKMFPSMDFKLGEPRSLGVNEIYTPDSTDLMLIRELSVNSKPVITDIAQDYDLSRSRLSRRIAKLRNLVCRDVQIYYTPEIFGLSTYQIVTGSFEDLEPSQLLSFPYPSYLVSGSERFLWYVNLPPFAVPQFNRFVLGHAQNLQIHPLDISSSRIFYFYPPAYTTRPDEEFVIQNCIRTTL